MLPPLSPEQTVKPRHFELRVAMLYACLFIPTGIHLPYFPLWLEFKQFGPNEIAVILSAPFFVRILAGPAVSAFADRASDRVPVLIGSAVLSTAACAAYFLSDSYLSVLVVSVLLAIAWAPHTPLSDSIALSGVRRYGSDYASMRVWGSISFLLANIAGGYILGVSGAGIVPAMMTIGFVSVIVAACLLPRIGRPRLKAPTPADTLPQAAFALRQPYFLLMIGGSALGQSAHAFTYAFSSIYWKNLGIADTTIGLLWAFSVACEVVMFFIFRRLFSRFRAGTTLAIGSAFGILRWLLFPLVWPAGGDVLAFFALQSLHAFSFSLVFLSSQKMFGQFVPEERMGAAQGTAALLDMTTMGVFMLASGPLFMAFGPHGYFAMAGVAAASVLLALLALRYPQSAGSGGRRSEP